MTHIYVIPYNRFSKEIESITDEDFIKMAFDVGCKYTVKEFVSAFNNEGFYADTPYIRAIDDGEQTQQTNLHRKFARNRNLVIDHLQSNLKDAKDFWSDGTDKSFIVGWLQQTIVQAIKMLKQN